METTLNYELKRLRLKFHIRPYRILSALMDPPNEEQLDPEWETLF